MALSIKVETIYSADIRIGGDDLNGYFINVEPPDGEPFCVEHLQVEDQGEDGMIVRGEDGRRHYVAVPPEAREEQMVVKSQNGAARLVLFAKAAGAP